LVGVERAREYQPDLIICDIMMPGLDGFGVLETLRKERATAKIPFIFLTARTERNDMRLGMELGADDYLTKPFTATELIKTVETRLERQKTFVDSYGIQIEALRSNIVLALPHELRTPLNVIMGFSDLLMYDAPTLEAARVADMARFINNAALRLYRLIENYLIYAQLEVAMSNPDQQKIMQEGSTPRADTVINEQAQYWVSNPHSPTEKREGDLELDVEEVETIAMTEDYLKKLVEELVDNACKFSTPGTPVIVKGANSNGQYVLSVSDQGVGMTQEQINSIGAYMQFDRRIREQQGAGLGLVICKMLTELHNGVFSMSSAPGKGTTVTVRLPVLR
jgi:signal transduction histidine kinase